jgi:hypothetical protein
MAVSAVVCWILVTRPCVSSRDDPPAPYVTDTNEGLSLSRLRSVSYRLFASFSVLGGKNSNEQVLVAFRKMSEMCIRCLAERFGAPVR